MNIQTTVESTATVVNAGGVFNLAFPYTSTIGKSTEQLSVQVPMKHEKATDNDYKALVEAVTIQGGMGRWVRKEDQSVWLVPAE
jgi:hypothetical protein